MIITRCDAHYEYLNNKKNVNKLYKTISGRCDDERKNSRGVKRNYVHEIGSINKIYKQIKLKMVAPAEEIEESIQKDFLRDYL